MSRNKIRELGDITVRSRTPFLQLGQSPEVSAYGSKWEWILEHYALSFSLLSCFCKHSFPSPSHISLSECSSLRVGAVTLRKPAHELRGVIPQPMCLMQELRMAPLITWGRYRSYSGSWFLISYYARLIISSRAPSSVFTQPCRHSMGDTRTRGEEDPCFTSLGP